MRHTAWLIGLVGVWAGCGPGGDDPGPSLDPCGPTPAVHDWAGGETLAWTGEGGWCARIERTAASAPDEICKACPFSLHRMVVVGEGVFVDETDGRALDYVPSHHNWADEARVTAGETTYVVRFGPSFGALSDVLEVLRDDEVDTAVPLTPRAVLVPGSEDNSATAQAAHPWGLGLD